MRLLSIDLNLLVALYALLEEKHVTKAGERVGLSQPAMSDALRRLRRYFDDEILVRVGNHYELTPLALVLRQRAAEAVEKVEHTFASRSSFDTAVLDRTFSVYANGNGMLNVIQPFLDDVRATGVDVRLRVLDVRTMLDDAGGLRNADGVLSPREFVMNAPSLVLYVDRWAIVTASGRDETLNLKDLEARPWIVPYDNPALPAVYPAAMKRLHALGLAPVADIVVEDFLSIPHLVAGSDRVSVMPRRLALRFASLIDVHDSTFEGPELIETFWWDSSHTADPRHVWFRGLLESWARRHADVSDASLIDAQA